MTHILLHTLLFSPDGVSTAIIVSELMEELQKLGHTITVLAAMPHYNRDPIAEAHQPLQKKAFGLYFTSTYQGMKVVHVRMPRKGERIGARFKDYLFFHFWSLLWGLLLIGRCDIVIAPSPPLTIGLVGWLLARLKGAKFVYNVQELYPAITVQVGLLKEDHLLYRFFLRLEKMVYTLADHLTVITPQFKKAILSKGVPLEKVSVIPNFVALDFDSLQPQQSDKYVVLYAGNIGMTQSFETIIEVIKRLHDEPNVHFLIVGDGVKRKYVESQVKNCPNVTMLPYQPLEVIPAIYKSADLGLVPLKTGTAKTTIPSKIYTIMGAGLPVLLSVDLDSDMITLMEEANCGIYIPPDNADAMEAALRQIYLERERFQQLGLKGKQFVEKTYSRQSVARQYDALIRKLTAE